MGAHEFGLVCTLPVKLNLNQLKLKLVNSIDSGILFTTIIQPNMKLTHHQQETLYHVSTVNCTSIFTRNELSNQMQSLKQISI